VRPADPHGINVVVENHGDPSSHGDWLAGDAPYQPSGTLVYCLTSGTSTSTIARASQR
jgi:hypothetical protein